MFEIGVPLILGHGVDYWTQLLHLHPQWLQYHVHVALNWTRRLYNSMHCKSPSSITPTFAETSPCGKLWKQIMKVADTNDDKSWNHEVSVKVTDINHESRGQKQSWHVEMFATKSMTSPRQTCLCCSNGIWSITMYRESRGHKSRKSATWVVLQTFMICVHDFPCEEVSMKVAKSA